MYPWQTGGAPFLGIPAQVAGNSFPPFYSTAGSGPGGVILPLDRAQDHIMFIDHNISFTPGAVGCSSMVNNTVGVSGTSGNAATFSAFSWTNSVHGANAGNLASMDGSVHQTTTSALREYLARGDDNGSLHFLKARQ